MKIFYALLIGLTLHSLNAQIPVTKIKEIMHLQTEAWNNGDVDSFMKYYWNNSELTFVSKQGISKGWDQVINNYKNGYPTKEAMGILTFGNLVFEKMNSKAYIVTGSWHLQKEEAIGGWFTLIFKKFKKDWLIVYDHTS